MGAHASRLKRSQNPAPYISAPIASGPIQSDTPSPARMRTTYRQRKAIAQDTVARIPEILEEEPEGSNESRFISEQLPPLSRKPGLDVQWPGFGTVTVRVVNLDAFSTARAVIKEMEKEDEEREKERGEEGRESTGRKSIKTKTAVLNLASDLEPGGGWTFTLSVTQEEALCYSSTLYTTLLPSYYPWKNKGPDSAAGVFSPSVVIFRHDLDHGCANLEKEERRVVSVITVAAHRSPAVDGGKLTKKTEKEMKEKARLVYRMAAWNGQDCLVLGAMGCGAYRCPPLAVAELMKEVLLETEFKGWFRRIVFAVYADQEGPDSNFEIFKNVLDGTEV